MRQSAPSTLQPVGLAAHPHASAPVSIPSHIPVPAPAPSPVPADTVDYPCSDGQPMAESQLHAKCIMYMCEALQYHFEQHHPADRYANDETDAIPDDAALGAYVTGNMFLYYEQGNRAAVVAPDVFVVHGVPVHLRDSYRLWNEPKGPDFVLEVTSKSTKETDLVKKRTLYASLGVEEYFLYDPRAEYLKPPLQGYRLGGGGYRPLPGVSRLPGGGASVYSAVLGLELRDERGLRRLRLHDPETGRDLLSYRESEAYAAREATARRTAEAHAAQEAAARRAAEARVERERARVAELEARLRALEGIVASSPGPRPPKPAS